MSTKNGIFSKVFEYQDKDGITQKLLLNPLRGDSFSDVFSMTKVFKNARRKANETDAEFEDRSLDTLTPEVIKTLHRLCRETVAQASPELTEDEVHQFVSSHFFRLFTIMIEVNLSSSPSK